MLLLLLLLAQNQQLGQFTSVIANYASPSSGVAYSDRQLTTNFEL